MKNDWEGLWPLGFILLFFYIVSEVLKAAAMTWITVMTIGYVLLMIGMLISIPIILLIWLYVKPKGWGIWDYFQNDIRKMHPVVVVFGLLFFWFGTMDLLFELRFSTNLISAFDFDTWYTISEVLPTIITISASCIYIRILFKEWLNLGRKFSCSECGKRSRYPSVNYETGHPDWNQPGDLIKCGFCGQLVCDNCTKPTTSWGITTARHYHSTQSGWDIR